MQSRRSTIVVGLGFGDCGKGSIVDYLARMGDAHTIVRFNGGPQAGHNVVIPNGDHHTFSQFGSATLKDSLVQTLLSRFMLIEPYSLLNEAAHLHDLGCKNIWQRLFIDERCVVITPPHQAANRLRELARGSFMHGSCGMGIGEATADAIDRPELTLVAGELPNPILVTRKLRAVAEFKAVQLQPLLPSLRENPAAAVDLRTIYDPQWIDVAVDTYFAIAGEARIISGAQAHTILRRPGEIIFEGAQGVLLDQDFGFHPYTTWSRTTTINAMQLLREAGVTENPRQLGVLRSYATRHGAGPLVTEDHLLRQILLEPHNADTGHQGAFRVGLFDAVAARYAIAVSQVDEIAITHVDAVPLLPKRFCNAYISTDADTACTFFHENGCDIRIADIADLAARAALTNALYRCSPKMADFNGSNWESLVQRIQQELPIPITLASFGATHVSKCELRYGSCNVGNTDIRLV